MATFKLNASDALIMARSEIIDIVSEAEQELKELRDAGRYEESPMAPYMLARKVTALDALAAIDKAMAHVVAANQA